MLKKIRQVANQLLKILTHRQKILFWLVLVCSFISAIFETLSVSVILPLVNALLTPERIIEHPYMQPIVTAFHIENNTDIVVFVISGTIFLYLIKNGYNILFSWIKAKYSSKIQRELSVYMMESYMNRGYTYFLDKNTNEIQQGVVGDVGGVYNIINSIIYSITKSLIVIMIAVFMILSDALIASSLVVAATLCLIVIMLGFKKPMKQVGMRLRDYTIESNQVLLQAIQGIKEVIVMRKQKDFVNLYEYHMNKRQKEDIKRVVATDAPNSIVEAFCITAIMIILGVRILGSEDPSVFIAMLASFAVGAFRIMPAIGYLSSSFNNIISSLPSLTAIYENMIEAREYNNKFNDVNIKDNEKYKEHAFSDSISINHITFQYKEELGNVLEDLSIKIEKNTSIGLVGESGAGKSTLVDIILGLLKPSQGEICLDNININEIPIKWSKLIGFVPQTIFLCDATIAENIAFGEAKEKIDEERVNKVLTMANINSFVNTLPEGIWTKVGERGVRLSGGQRQRMGIARALYHNPEILILDEATSALDNETEKTVMEAIENLQGNITMIIIAHRLSTISKCDEIYEIVKGKAIKRRYEEL